MSNKATHTFPSRTAAHKVRRRLQQAGFGRNSIGIFGNREEGFELSVKTTEDRVDQAQRLITMSPVAYAFNQNRALVLGAAAVAGAVLYAMSHRREANDLYAMAQTRR